MIDNSQLSGPVSAQVLAIAPCNIRNDPNYWILMWADDNNPRGLMLTTDHAQGPSSIRPPKWTPSALFYCEPRTLCAVSHCMNAEATRVDTANIWNWTRV